MKKLIIFTCILFLTGCYEFESPPFSEDELKPISKLKLGQTILNAVSEVSVDKNSPIVEFSVLTSIKVPPLKSIPKFKPLKNNKITESNIAIDDAIKNIFL